MNQRMLFNSIAKKVTVDLLGHREMHVRRASLPVVAPSRAFPFALMSSGEVSPPPTFTGVK